MTRTGLEKDMTKVATDCESLARQVEFSSEDVNNLVTQQQDAYQSYNTQIEVRNDQCVTERH